MNNDQNAGHQMATTENALLFGHRFGDDLYTGFKTGTMVVMRHLGPRIGEAEGVIQPPSDMHLPTFRPQFDPVYADALYAVLAGLGANDPDLPGAIRWLEARRWGSGRYRRVRRGRRPAFAKGRDTLGPAVSRAQR